ncbi:uncharacterized protein METZ01_LOCUS216659 [marine metagenome]|uniref:Uncharacterized protein n=1 Tax=marine metagenome TaxID=408172 RepID=A0A382FMF7_9ZZZZ
MDIHIRKILIKFLRKQAVLDFQMQIETLDA